MVRRTRFSVSLPSPLVEEFDALVKDMGYSTRSKAVHDAISAFIVENRASGKGEPAAGALVCLYYRDVKGLVEKIEDEQQKHSSIISSSLHIALDSKRCMRIFAVRGHREEIFKFAQDLQTRRGVRHLKLAMMS
ncbi:MAG: nickel-responsive transcriptional regulator NikR [Candidatus Brockarchaeota archaeon]|nr:nickel-responsive transcriptional regulator NikR [Candidatus Brockarchaeota archaeon]